MTLPSGELSSGPFDHHFSSEPIWVSLELSAASSSFLASSEPCSMGGGYLQESRDGVRRLRESGRDGARVNGLRVRGRRWSGDGRGGEGRYSRRGEVLLQGPEEEADLRWGGASSVKDRKAACAYLLVSSACAW